jgi:oxygen-dependent protoporphyrinogen oxidase
MNKTLMNTRHVVIVGGGITGLAAAFTLQQEARAEGIPVTFTLIEAKERLGGKIVTEHEQGFTIEGGPDCFIRQKPWASELCIQLGLGDELIGTNDHQRKTYVVNKGRLAPLPDGVMLIVPTRIMPFVTSRLISWPGKIRMGLDLLIPPVKHDHDESVGEFVRRRLGREALDKIAEPLMGGIHVSDPDDQSILATFPRFRNIEKKHGSLIKGMLAERRLASKKNGHAAAGPSRVPSSIFVSLRGGLGQLVEKLEANLAGEQVIRGVQVNGIERNRTGTLTVMLDNGRHIDADAVVLATPAYVSASLLRPILPVVSKQLDAIRYVSTATISMAYRIGDIRKPFMGFGLVVPRKEKRQISACTWTSFKFNHRAPEKHLLLRCFVGGPGKEDLVDLDDSALVDVARRELRDLLEIDAAPILTRVFRWHKANPQYDVGHLDRVKVIQAQAAALPGLYLCGSAFDGVGVPDCVRQGQETARKVMRALLQPEEELAVL